MKEFLILAFLLLIILIILRINNKTKRNYSHQTTKKPIILSIENYQGGIEYFGYKSVWMAIKSDDNKVVAEFIKQLEDNYPDALIFKHHTWRIIITSIKDGWVFLTGDVPGDGKYSMDRLKYLIIKLSEEFEDAQFFATHRVVEYHCWARAVNGNLKRIYAYLGESGENVYIEGDPIGIEKNYKLVNTFSGESKLDGYYEQPDLTFPDESLVMLIAEDWSLNPSKFSDDEWRQLWTNAMIIKQ